MAEDYFWSLKKQIEEEYYLFSLGLAGITDDELSETLYKRFSQQIEYLQNLFDNISVEAKELDLSQTNPEFYKLLEAKQEISDCYGQFNRQKNIFYKRFSKFRDTKEEDFVRQRSEPDAEEEAVEEIPEELPEDMPEVLDIEEELDPEAEAAQKAAQRKERQKKLAKEARKRDEQNEINRLRQEEAARLGFLAHPDQPVSEADIYQERIRQDVQVQQEAAREAARIQAENEALRRTQERMEQANRFDRVQSSHIDMSRENIGHHAFGSDPQLYENASSADSSTSFHKNKFPEVDSAFKPKTENVQSAHEQRLEEQPSKATEQPSKPFHYNSHSPESSHFPEETHPFASDVRPKEQYIHYDHLQGNKTPQGHPSGIGNVGGFVPYQFTPAGPETIPIVSGAAFSKTADSNAKIYSALMSNRSENENDSITASPALETQMRFNVERARMAYADAKGTAAAPAAAHEYIVQRNALSQYRSAVQQGIVRVATPPAAPVSFSSQDNIMSAPGKAASGSAVIYAFSPTGTTAKTIEKGMATGNQYVFVNHGPSGKPAYSATRPMVVSNKYEQAIINKMRMATESLDAAIVKGESKARSVNPAEVKMYTDAYLAFQKAKRDGTVVVSDKAEGHDVPDYYSWQQRHIAQKTKSSAIGGSNPGGASWHPSGITGQSFGPNPNRTQKKTVDETSANIFNSSSLLRRQSLATVYAKQLGTRFEYWATGATFSLSRHMYRMVQSGEDNSLRTMETGRYYITTATGVALVAFSTAPVEKLGKRVAHASAREFHMYGTKSFLTNSELSATVNNGLRTTRELNSQIAGIEAQLAPMKEKMGASGLDKYSQRQFDKLSAQLEYLKGERASAAKSLSMHEKLKSLRSEAKMEAELHKMLEKDGSLPKNARKLRESAQKINEQVNADMQKKYGAYSFEEKGRKVPLLKASDKSLKAEIADIKLQGGKLKARIKALEAKGSSLTLNERRLLMDLKSQTKKLGRELARLEGLSRDRARLSFWNKKLDSLIKKASKDWGRIYGGLYALQGFMIRPLQVGAESNTEGLAATIRISSNRYVHILVKKSFKASIFLTKGAMNMIAPGSVQAMETSLFMAKTSIKAHANMASNAIKTSVRTGIRSAGNAISSAVPSGIKTGVKSVVSAGTTVKGKYSNLVNGLKNFAKDTKVWFYNTSVGRGVSAVARFSTGASEAIKGALSLLKGVALKAIAIVALIFVLIGVISLGFGMSAGVTGGSVIASPNTSEDGKIDLSSYMQVISREQNAFQRRIDGYMKDSRYDEVYLNYSGAVTNTKHILSMMAVRMSQDLDMDKNSEVENYIVSLFNDSHKISLHTVERTCAGCKEREEYVRVWNSYLKQWEYEYYWDEDAEEYVRKTKIVKYCSGHTDLYIDVSILVFDEIFTADSYANEGQTANAGEKIGDFTITYYCIEKYPHICNDGDASNTATGTVPTPGRTIAVDPDVIPLGTHVIIDGHEYIAEDTGGAINQNRIDIVVKTHQEALQKGTRHNVPVYYPSYEGGSYEETGQWDGWTEENIEWCKLIFNMPWHELYSGYFEYGSVVDSGELVVSGDFMWPVSSTYITSPYGPRNAPVAGASTYHKGVDIAVGTGTPVHAAADGTVIVSAYDSAAGYYMAIDHGNGIVTRYLHNSVLNFNVGDTVKQGDIVTYSGATGIGSGPHLHFEFIVNGTPIDPCVQFNDVSFSGNWDNPYC